MGCLGIAGRIDAVVVDRGGAVGRDQRLVSGVVDGERAVAAETVVGRRHAGEVVRSRKANGHGAGVPAVGAGGAGQRGRRRRACSVNLDAGDGHKTGVTGRVRCRAGHRNGSTSTVHVVASHFETLTRLPRDPAVPDPFGAFVKCTVTGTVVPAVGVRGAGQVGAPLRVGRRLVPEA